MKFVTNKFTLNASRAVNPYNYNEIESFVIPYRSNLDYYTSRNPYTPLALYAFEQQREVGFRATDTIRLKFIHDIHFYNRKHITLYDDFDLNSVQIPKDQPWFLVDIECDLWIMQNQYGTIAREEHIELLDTPGVDYGFREPFEYLVENYGMRSIYIRHNRIETI